VSQQVLRASTVNINDGRWHYVVATYDGATKRLYIDGVLRASANWAGPIRDSAYPVMIGANAQQPNRNWNGWIDEVAFWNRAIEPEYVHSMYNRGNGLDLSFSGQVNLRGTGPAITQPFRPTFAGSINSSGEFRLSSQNGSATLLGFGFSDIDLEFSRALLPSSTATLRGAATLNALSGTPFSVNPRFAATFTHAAGVTTATLNAQDQTMSLGGYAPALGGFDLSVSGSLGNTLPISFSDFRFGNSFLSSLGLPALNGTVLTSGTFSIFSSFLDDITLIGFRAPTANLNFSNAGLTVSGTFDLNVTRSGNTRSFGNVAFSGKLNSDGSFTLPGTGSIRVGAYLTDSIALTLSSANSQITVSAVPNLNFGALDMPIQNFGLKSDDFKGTMNKTFGPLTANHLDGHLNTSFAGNIFLTYDFATGALSGNVGASWGWNCANFVVPNNWLPSGNFSVNYGISDSGSFTVNNDSASGSYFFAPFWQGPNSLFVSAPGWFWGSISSQSYDLW
jgi:hypothetical protein